MHFDDWYYNMGMRRKYSVVDRTPWQLWFAWRPVRTINGETIFWKQCYRRYVTYTPRYGDSSNRDGYEYANIFNLIK